MEELQTTELDRIKTLLNATFHGGAWHGPSVLENLKDIKPKTAGIRQKNIHTIAELVYHITTWRIFALKKIQGDEEFVIKTEKQNWGNIIEVDEFEWETLQMELTLSHDELISALEEKDDSFLTEIVPGAEYDFYTLLHGIIHHDLYHNGQIGILKKSAPKVSKFDDEDEFRATSYFEDEY
ncbi:hypothetical protein GCM10011514_13870 [Emticicia aquatilis]|uniref:DinB-like domain-containing protein n=1 Tax=Emticicia aquatilis TaxID=1537369 RepID=A0A916YN31_9BACT|nr:DinB family protein [Emticicia aquatilis]GGD50876.1 hypothetical protein GCM10011514_13870 [Emticicia aquatilis]